MSVIHLLKQKFGAKDAFGVITIFPNFVFLFFWPANFALEKTQDFLIIFHMILANKSVRNILLVISHQIFNRLFSRALDNEVDEDNPASTHLSP